MSVKSSLRGAQARWLALSAAFGLACFLIAYGSLLLTRADGQLAAIWPVDGVALGFILRHPRRSAWPVIFGTWTGCAAANLCWGDPPQIALVLPLANVAGVAGALFGLLRLVRRPNLLRARHLATLIVIGSVAAIGSGILGAGWLWLVDGQNFSSNALGWAVCDALGYATLAPLVQLATTPRRRVRWPSPGSVAVLLGFTAVVIAALSQNDDAFVFIVPLALFVVAYVAEASGAAVALVIAAVTSVGFLAKNLGPLSLVGGGARAQLFTLQIFLASMVFSILPIAAAMRERRRFAAAVLAARDRARQSMRRAREARRRAEEAAMERTAMLADMSHELRTPVACVLGFSNLLRDLDGLSDEARRLATGVAFASENLMSAVDGVLQFTKAEAPPTEAPTRMALACLLDNVLLLFGPQAQAKGLRIEAEIAATAPTEAQLYAGRLRQILMNLMGNAVKYTDAGSVVLRASVASPAGDLLFEVIDTGPGVPAERAQ